MFGLGHYIYAGEDLPEESVVVAPPKKEGKVIIGAPEKKERNYEIDLGDHDIFEVLKAISAKKKAKQSWEQILLDMRKKLGVTVQVANQIKHIYNEQAD